VGGSATRADKRPRPTP
jgi:hypothetical protein